MREHIKKYLMYAMALLLSFAIIFLISRVQRKLDDIIVKKELVDQTIVKNGSPIVVFTTVVLGSFRGLIADYLWIRASNLQEQEKYYEMVQLASWITKLQPKFTGATSFLAWNMAYNISVTCSLPEDRWKWVQRGIELIRDEALEYNSNDPLLYKELGWIYQHKIGNILDDANLYYKYEMAKNLMRIYGGPAPNFNVFAKTPRTIREFKKQFPEKELKKILKKGRFISLEALEENFRENGELPKDIQNNFPKELLSKLDNFLRVRWMLKKYKLDPKVAYEINQKYGQLDWRVPETFAIYWATRGLEHTKNHRNRDCERMITQSLHDTFQRGHLLLLPNADTRRIITVPNLNVVDAVYKAYLDAYEVKGAPKSGGGTRRSFHDGMINFVRDAVVMLYSYGRKKKALEYYRILRKDNPRNPVFRLPLEQYVFRERLDDIKNGTRDQILGLINGMLYQSCIFILNGDYEAGKGVMDLAQVYHVYYTRANEDTKNRVGIAPFKTMKKEFITRFMELLTEKQKIAFKARLDDVK